MLIRLLPAAIASAVLLLTGCQTLHMVGYVPPDKRDKTVFSCGSNCYVQVDPGKAQWVPEDIYVNRGGIIQFWLTEGWEFDTSAITLKIPADPAPMVCHGTAKRIRTCDVSPGAAPKVKVGYTIHVKGKEPYDPFVWPQ